MESIVGREVIEEVFKCEDCVHLGFNEVSPICVVTMEATSLGHSICRDFVVVQRMPVGGGGDDESRGVEIVRKFVEGDKMIVEVADDIKSEEVLVGEVG